MKGESGTRDIINGVGAGIFFTIFLSLYMDAFTGVTLPVWMIYGILTPLVSAVFIAVLVLSHKEKREIYTVKYWQNPKKKKEL